MVEDNTADIDPGRLLLSLGEIEVHLHTKPDVRAAAEGLREPNGHFRGDSGLAVDKVIECLTGDAEALCCVCDRQPQGLDTVIPDMLAGVWGVLHTHVSFLLVVINQIYIQSITVFKAEYDPPVGADGDGPEALEAAFEGVQLEARRVHIVREVGCVEPGKDTCYLVDILRRQLASIVIFKELSQCFVLETPYHFFYSNMTIVSCQVVPEMVYLAQDSGSSLSFTFLLFS